MALWNQSFPKLRETVFIPIMWYLKNVSSWVKDLGKIGAFSSTVRTSPQIPPPSWRNGSKKGPIGFIRLDGRSRRIKVIDLSLVRSLKNLISHPRFPPSSASCWLQTFIRWLHVLTSLSTSHHRALCKHLQTSGDRVKEPLAAAHGDLFTQEEIKNNKQRHFGSSEDDMKGLEKYSPGRRD